MGTSSIGRIISIDTYKIITIHNLSRNLKD